MQGPRVQDDPVSRAIFSCPSRKRFPVPLIATTYNIDIRGGLANISATRKFLNSERLSLEAILTFPLPVHAVLYELKATIGDRELKAVAKARNAARETYEQAIDGGRLAVLHEELIKGVHMLSVGHLPPGAEISVEARFALPLAMIGGQAMLRIPTTVGDIYGTSGLAESDEITADGTLLAGDVTIRCDSGTPKLLGATLENGTARVWLDAPIVVEIEGWKPKDLAGLAADGKPVSIRIEPAPGGEANLDAAILVDHSGSMAENCAQGARISKHAAVLLGLDAAGQGLTKSDRINLWEFNLRATDLGTACAEDWHSLLFQLSRPDDGTEIGRSIEKVLAERRVRDILLVTDGKSHALDVAKLAESGVRFTVVLIGEDSLDANVGHLAMLTGGEIFVPAGAEVSAALQAALRSLRSPAPASSHASTAEVRVSGMTVLATWDQSASGASAADAGWARAVAAYCASLRLRWLKPGEATELAEREGLVTHLTSLVLVDTEGKLQSGIPATRKVDLPSPATSRTAISLKRSAGLMDRSASPTRLQALHCFPRSHAPSASPRALSERPSKPRSYAREIIEGARPKASNDAGPAPRSDRSGLDALSKLGGRIDWRRNGERLIEGNMLALPDDVADAIDEAAAHAVVRRAAKRLGLSPRILVVGLLARSEAGTDRYAERFARAVFGKAKARDVASIASHLGL